MNMKKNFWLTFLLLVTLVTGAQAMPGDVDGNGRVDLGDSAGGA